MPMLPLWAHTMSLLISQLTLLIRTRLPEMHQYGMPVAQQLNEYGMPVDAQGNYAPVLNQYGVPVDTTAYNGQPVQNAAPAAPAQQPKYCKYCGAPLQPGNKFCDSCGSKIGE